MKAKASKSIKAAKSPKEAKLKQGKSKEAKSVKAVKAGKSANKKAIPITPLTVSVLVTYVELGGNVGAGAYQYTCVPDVVHVEDADAVVSYEMSAHTLSEFVFTGLYTTDSMYEPQLSEFEIKAKGRRIEITHANTVATLIDVSLQIQDTGKNKRVNCDPQITNNPGGAAGYRKRK
jgi:hypothetical protein